MTRFVHGNWYQGQDQVHLPDVNGRQVYRDIAIEQSGSCNFDLDGYAITYVPTAEGNYRMEVGRLPGHPDTDDDGLSDIRETLLGTRVDDKDTDGDLLTDWFEVRYGPNPLVPNPGLPMKTGMRTRLPTLKNRRRAPTRSTAIRTGMVFRMPRRYVSITRILLAPIRMVTGSAMVPN